MSQKINFTKSELDKLVYNRISTTYYYDNKVPHHRLVITKTGRKTFQVYMRVDGVPTKRTLGCYPDITPEQAREMARKKISELIMGKDTYKEKKSLKNEPTYNDIWAGNKQKEISSYLDYLEDKAWQKPKTAKKNISQHISLFKKYPAFHKLRLNEITTDKLINFHRDYSIKQGKKVMADNIIRQIRACFYYANYEPNPAVSRKIKLNKKNKRSKYLRAQELQDFVNAALLDQSRDYRDVFLLCLFTASRIGSIMSMEWKEVKLKYGVWEPITKVSNNENDSTTIGLIKPAIELLQRRKELNTEKSKWVFPATSKSGHVSQPQKAFKRILVRAGLEGFTPHDLRRTALSHYGQSGATDQELLTLSGNKTLDTRDIYVQRDVKVVNEQYSNVINYALKDIKII